jgi:hypothetical protein
MLNNRWIIETYSTIEDAMRSTRLLFAASLASSLALATCRPALAQASPAWIGAPDCRVAAPSPAPAQPPAWSGSCKDRFADGKGVLEWRNDKGQTRRLEGTFATGQVQGEATLRYTAGAFYKGSFKNNTPDGHGYVRYADDRQYEGAIRMGELEGVGEMLYANGDDYKGEFKNDKPDGAGVMTYMLGGRYEGNWKNGKPSGSGKLVYAGQPLRATATVDGQNPNRHYLPVEKTYSLKQDHSLTGSLLPLDAARAIPVPPNLGYAQLSAQEQAMVNGWYPALAPGDEPPYPLHGPAEFYRFVSQVVSKTQQRGVIRVYVVVDKDGKAVGVTALGLDDPEVSKVISLGAAKIAYKPARCAGQPCEMSYGYNLALKLE